MHHFISLPLALTTNSFWLLPTTFQTSNDEDKEEAEEETYEGVIGIPSDDEIIIFWD